MNEKELLARIEKETKTMEEVFATLLVKDGEGLPKEFLAMAHNYFKDSKYFMGKKDPIRAFEAVVISWAYVDAGIKAGFFSVPDGLSHYFTA